MQGSVKKFKSYQDQVELLKERGMEVDDPQAAAETLRLTNYYRLSGYWYPFRELLPTVHPDDPPSRKNEYFVGTRLADVVALYEFDTRLRYATFASLMPIELTIRALLGHELGRIDPLIHLDPTKLGATARTGSKYTMWREKYDRELSQSREDFVQHHRNRYGSVLPVWAAVEIMDWGSLAYLYEFWSSPFGWCFF